MRVRNRLPPSFWLIRQYSVDCFAVRPGYSTQLAAVTWSRRGPTLSLSGKNSGWAVTVAAFSSADSSRFQSRLMIASWPRRPAAYHVQCDLEFGSSFFLVQKATGRYTSVWIAATPPSGSGRGVGDYCSGPTRPPPGLLCPAAGPLRRSLVPVRFLSSRSSRPPCRPTLRQLCGTAVVDTFPGWHWWLG